MIYLISGDGRGAGKSTLARNLAGEENVYSLAGKIREELKTKYPQYDWHSKDQAVKDGTMISEWGSVSMREVMVRYGQAKCEEVPTYWVDRLTDLLELDGYSVFDTFPGAIDDIRKPLEAVAIRAWADMRQVPVLHIHVVNPLADDEPFANGELRGMADYLVTWQAKRLDGEGSDA